MTPTKSSRGQKDPEKDKITVLNPEALNLDGDQDLIEEIATSTGAPADEQQVSDRERRILKMIDDAEDEDDKAALQGTLDELRAARTARQALARSTGPATHYVVAVTKLGAWDQGTVLPAATFTAQQMPRLLRKKALRPASPDEIRAAEEKARAAAAAAEATE